MTIIKATNLQKAYHKHVKIAFKSCTIDKGKTYLLVGKNGSGKSTLIKLMLSLIFPTKGSLNLSNVTIGYIPERAFFPEWITIYEFLYCLCCLRHMDCLSIKTTINQMLLEWELDGSKKLSHCSKGMQQKVLILQAIIHKPQVYIFDEPINGLDKRMQQKFIKYIAYLKQHKKTIIIATHHQTFYRKYVDEIISI